MKKSLKLNPAVFIEAAILIDSHKRDLGCLALRDAYFAFSVDYLLVEYLMKFDLFLPGQSRKYKSIPWWGGWVSCSLPENRNSRILALLLCAAMVA